jgi:hypothetical protein
MTYASAECRWKTPDDGQRNCPKHVDFLDKNKFGKLLRLLVLLKRNLVCELSICDIFLCANER